MLVSPQQLHTAPPYAFMASSRTDRALVLLRSIHASHDSFPFAGGRLPQELHNPWSILSCLLFASYTFRSALHFVQRVCLVSTGLPHMVHSPSAIAFLRARPRQSLQLAFDNCSRGLPQIAHRPSAFSRSLRRLTKKACRFISRGAMIPPIKYVLQRPEPSLVSKQCGGLAGRESTITDVNLGNKKDHSTALLRHLNYSTFGRVGQCERRRVVDREIWQRLTGRRS